MWGLFAAAVVLGAVLLILPGYMLLRACHVVRFIALGASPLVSVACYSVLAVAYGVVGVACSWVSVFVPCLIVGIMAFAVSQAVARRRLANGGAPSGRGSPTAARREESNPSPCLPPPAQAASPHPDGAPPFDSGIPHAKDCALAAAYVAVGVVVSMLACFGQFASPDAFVQSWDNVHHLDAVRGFIDSGRWSSLGTTLYLGQDAAIDPFVEGAFYPSAWHAFAAMLAGALGLGVPLAVNAANLTIMAVAYPLGVWALLRVLFGNDRIIGCAGALVMLANPSCPWMMLTWGPLYPNVMALCLLPGFMAVFVLLFADGVPSSGRVALAATIILGAVSFVFVQPNGVFTALVLLSPFFVVRIYELAAAGFARRSAMHPKLPALALAAIATLAVVVVWIVAFNAPFMQGVVQYRWPCDTELVDALLDVATQRFHANGLALGCSLLLLCGIVSSLVRGQSRWLVASWAFSCAIYVVCVSVDGYWHQFAAGFWYTDVPRIAAFAAFAAVPLQALGLGAMMRAASRPFAKSQVARAASMVVLAMVAGVLLYAPVEETESHDVGDRRFTNASALASESARIAGGYSFADPRVYDEAERAFVAEAISRIPEGSLVVNEPNDGTAYAHGVDGLRTYYRYWRGYGNEAEGEKPESVLIREGLCNIAADEAVRDAVDSVGASYVIQLEQGERDWNHTMWVYGDGALWRGIDAIDEETPGFELVYSRDDMRLYKIL